MYVNDSALGGQKRVLDAQKVELHTGSYKSYGCELPNVSAWNQTWVLWRSNKFSEPLSHLPTQ